MNANDELKEMGFTNNKFPLATHMCLIYNSDEERKSVISKYIKEGIESGEKVLYLADNASKEDIIHWLEELGIDMKNQPKNFQIQDAEKVYCSDGYFSPEKMLDALKNAHDKAENDGYCCLRASGEMTWALKGYPGSEKLIEYESRLNELIQTYPFLAICQYDANKFDGKTIFEVLQVHPFMIVKGKIIINPYYIPPSEFLKKNNN